MRRQYTKPIKRPRSIKIQAFHKPNSKAGISDTISLFTVHLSHI
jgi:hypothetical protein